MKVLIIHSHSIVRNNLKTVLGDEYFLVDAVGDICNGVISTCLNDFNVVILEHALPQIDAEWFCVEIRKRGRTVPILVLVSDDQAAGIACLEKGADDFMRIPFETTELLARARCLARRSGDIHEDLITIEHLTIDRRARVVKTSGRDISLTQKEYLIVEFLALRQGAIVSKREIIEHCWAESEDLSLTASVDTHIYRIRRKIRVRGRTLIRNITRRGFRLG
jgi:DNA-binding response OmpR family regulator